MSPLDAIAFLLIVGFIIRGVWVGFIRQVASLSALLLAFLVAGHYYGTSSHLVTPFIRNEQLGFLVAYAVIFGLVFILTIFIGLGCKKVANLIIHEWFDKTLGGFLGAIKGLFLASIAFMALAIFISGSSPIFTKSILYPYLQKTSSILLSVVANENVRARMTPRQPAISDLLTHTIEMGKELGREAKEKASNY